MKSVKSLVVVAAFGALVASSAAQADTIVWKDPVYGFTMSYPDSWTLNADDTPNTRLRVAGPYAENIATCRMKVIDDGRLQIYPKSLMTEAVDQKLDMAFWEKETGQYADAKITDYYAPASLGDKGDATAVKVTFNLEDGKKKWPMQGVMIASVYGNHRYVASCSSRTEVYGQFSSLFMSILDSVQLDDRYHPFPQGYYRDFLADPHIVFPRTKPGTSDGLKQKYLSATKYYK